MGATGNDAMRAIVVQDPALELQFLLAVFGGQIVETSKDARGQLENASARIEDEVIQVRKGEPGAEQGNPGLVLRVQDLDMVCQEARGNGAKEVHPPTKQGNSGRETRIVDPCGVTWRVVEIAGHPPTKEVKRRLFAQRRNRL